MFPNSGRIDEVELPNILVIFGAYVQNTQIEVRNKLIVRPLSFGNIDTHYVAGIISGKHI